MRRIRTIFLAVIAIVCLVLMSGCSAETTTTAPPSSDDVKAAMDFMTDNPPPSSIQDEQDGNYDLLVGIVLSTSFSTGGADETTWKMTLCLPDGSSTIIVADENFAKKLNGTIHPGDYLAVDGGSDDKIGHDSEIRVLRPAVINITGVAAGTPQATS